jgi:hypothetical protein
VSQVSVNDVGGRRASTACGARSGVRVCLCERWLALGQAVICEDEIPVDRPTVISVIEEMVS